MNLSEYADLDATAMAEMVRRRDVKPQELSDLALKALNATQAQVNATAELWPAEAEDLQNTSGPLAGVPFLIKDIGVFMKGRKVELGSQLIAGLEAPFDTGLMRRFRAAGLVTVGRTISPEMAFSSTTEPTFHGAVRNPWDPARAAGGSSGGAGAAVACGAVPIAHGTDGGGSLRIPASFCGVFAIKPSRGRVSNGPIADEFISGLAAQLGISRSVRDSAALLDAVHGLEPGDPYGIAAPNRPYVQDAATDPAPLRIGLQLNAANGKAPDAEVADCVRAAAQLCRDLGHQVEEAEMPLGMSWDAFVEANAQVWTANLTSTMNDLAGMLGRSISRENVERSTLACYEYGSRISAEQYLRALGMRNTVARSVATFFGRYDLVLTPTMPAVAQALGDFEARLTAYDGLAWTSRLFDHTPYTAAFNVAGLPATSVPLGMGAESGMPVGIQFGAAYGREDLLLQLAGQLERAAPWIQRRPRIWAGR